MLLAYALGIAGWLLCGYGSYRLAIRARRATRPLPVALLLGPIGLGGYLLAPLATSVPRDGESRPANPTLLDHPAISKRVFFPRPATATPDLVVECDDAQIGCYLRRADHAVGIVVYFHGNGELAVESDWYTGQVFNGAGWDVCFVEYRGYGQSTDEPKLAAMLDDGERVVAALGVPPERVVAFGRSLGSLYAVELARRLPTLGGLVLESAIADVLETWPLGDAAETVGCDEADLVAAVNACLDQRAKLAGYHGPLLVLHAADDRHLDVSHAERLRNWAGGADRRLVVFPNGDHNSILLLNAVEYVAEVKAFLRKVEPVS